MTVDLGRLPRSEAADAYLDALPAGRFFAFPVTGMDRTGIPVWAVSHLGHDSKLRGGFGYGSDDPEALVGALGELTEQLRSAAVVPHLPSRSGSYDSLRGDGLEAVHPWSCCAPAGGDVDGSSVLEWVAAVAVAGPRQGSEVWVPLDLVASSPGDLPAGYAPYTTPVSNGLGAHSSFAAAVEHGACEVVQRDGNGVAFRGLDAGIVVEPPGSVEVLDAYRQAGIEVMVKLASTDLGVANLYVTSAGAPDPDLAPIIWTGCGEAADPDPAAALRKAVLEYAASRARKAFSHLPLDAVGAVADPGYLSMVAEVVDPDRDERRALDAMVDWLRLDAAAMHELLADRVMPVRRHEPWSSVTAACPTPTTPVVDLLGAAGFEVLAVDLSDGEVAAAKVVIPGMEVETISYDRIGERNVARLVERDLGLAGIGPAPEGCLAVRLLPDAEERLGGPAWYDPSRAGRLTAGLYPLYREPSRHAAGIAARRPR